MLSFFIYRLKQDPGAQLCLLFLSCIFLLGIFAPWIVPHDPLQINIQLKYQPISANYLLGTDNLGRCVFSRLIYGIRTTLFSSLFAMCSTLFIGTVLGLVAGYFGGKVDNAIMGGCDLMLAFPDEIIILALVGIFGPGIKHILLAIVLIKWAWYSRMIRGSVRQYEHKNYVCYARMLGIRSYKILYRHILPLIFTDIMILATTQIGSVILLISSLSFLGLGVQPPTPEWGSMLNSAKIAIFSHPAQILPTSITITLVVVMFNYFGDFLRDTVDPTNRYNKNKILLAKNP